jgi:hypothetical protein
MSSTLEVFGFVGCMIDSLIQLSPSFAVSAIFQPVLVLSIGGSRDDLGAAIENEQTNTQYLILA